MIFRGFIKCKTCGTKLAQANGVLEREKAWSERMAIWNCRPNCEHAEAEIKAKKGLCFNIEVVWEPEEDAA